MTDNEIIKALECCIKSKCEQDCFGCPYYGETSCLKKNGADILNLINRQKAEIERLKAKCENTQIGYNFAKADIESLKTELNELATEYKRLDDTVTNGAEICHNCHLKYAEKIEQDKAEAFKELAEKIKEEIRLILKDAYDERRTRIRNLEDECRYVGLDAVVKYYEGKIHSSDRVYRFIDNFLKEMVGDK